jgi:hypothetical protein
VRSAILAFAVVVATVAAAMGPAQASQPLRGELPKYSFETLYELRPGTHATFDRYWATLEDLSRRGGPRYARWVDGTADGASRLVTLPVLHLAELGNERRDQEALRTILGAAQADAVIAAFDGAQLSRTSYIRQYRSELSANRERYRRGAASELSFVTVLDGHEATFERVWRRAVEAYRRAAPMQVITVSRTVVGGGPQFVITRPASADALEPAQAVGHAFGEDAQQRFEADLRKAVSSWVTKTYVNLGVDTGEVRP